MAEMPRTLKVGPFQFQVVLDTIRVVEHERQKDQGRCCGFTNRVQLTITLDPELAAGQLRDTLWHEVKHAVLTVGYFPDKPTEESVIAAMCPLELAVLRENPALVAYLLAPD